MSLGPEKIILILVVALIVFGPQRLPEIARQVGAAMRELRRMQDTVRGELEQVLRPEFMSPGADAGADEGYASIEESDHAAPAPGSGSTETAPENAGENRTEDVADDGFAGPRSFS
ncbi:MAG: twin-arginine translocase TatA/TatE family subunit [Actinomycetota bacterium]|nr:twin-arginine translocase TatA/TatE family subunit [Actinomycetota bacterium]